MPFFIILTSRWRFGDYLLFIMETRTYDELKETPETKKNNARAALSEFAYLGGYKPWNFRKEALEYLAIKKALSEKWSFDGEAEDSYSILDNYLRYTFFRLFEENKIEYTKDGKWACFNTGLVNQTYVPIYALFQKNRNTGKQPWYFCAFIADGEKWGKFPDRCSVADFPRRPRRAQYLDNPSDLLYLVSEEKNELSLNFDHIFDRAERLPIDLLNELSGKQIPIKKQRGDFSNQIDYETYLLNYSDELQDVINEGNTRRRLQERFKTAVDMTRDRIVWNYKTAIPMYYPSTGKISLLLPLNLVKEDKVDLALVVSKGDGGYLAETIYPLNWAYRCARLICRPDSDWLTPSTITNDSGDEEDND